MKPGDRFRAQNGSIVKVVKMSPAWGSDPSLRVVYEYEFSPGTLWERADHTFLSRFTPVEASP